MATNYTYPVEKNHKGSTATVYLTPIRGEAAFTIVFYEAGKRRRKVVMDEAEAHTEADKIVKRLAGGELKLNGDEGRIYNAYAFLEQGRVLRYAFNGDARRARDVERSERGLLGLLRTTSTAGA